MESGTPREVAALNQRIRRVLSMFRTVAAHVGGNGRDPVEAALHWHGRIGAIGRVVAAPGFPDGVDLELLLRDELLLQAARPEQFSIRGPDVRLAAKAAEFMSLAIHELATNAVKFGALAQPQARISVAWQVLQRAGVRTLHFEWLEGSVQRMGEAPSTAGFGAELLKRLIARELKGEGEMTFLPDGVRCTIEFPLINGEPRDD
jgi:hypothetical protein